MVRVLHVFSGLRRNGAESRTIDIYRKIDKSKVQFDFMVHTFDECDYDKEVLELGAKIYHIKSYRIVNHFSYIKAWDVFFKAHPEYKIVHIHVSNIAAPILYAAKKNNVEVRIVHSRNGHQSELVKILYLKLTRKCINKWATHRFAVSKEAGNYVFGTAEYEVWPNAIEVSRYLFNEKIRDEYRKELNLVNCHVYGHIGRFIKQKNHRFLIEIFEGIYSKDNNSRLLLIGVGDDKEKIENYVKELGLEDVVIFLGKRTDIPQLLSIMDVFLFPSLFEGLPGVVLEAQANGLPCLISEHITKEVAITDLVEYMSLKESSDNWAIRSMAQSRREDLNVYQMFLSKGFDIEDLAVKYDIFYRSQYV